MRDLGIFANHGAISFASSTLGHICFTASSPSTSVSGACLLFISTSEDGLNGYLPAIRAELTSGLERIVLSIGIGLIFSPLERTIKSSALPLYSHQPAAFRCGEKRSLVRYSKSPGNTSKTNWYLFVLLSFTTCSKIPSEISSILYPISSYHRRPSQNSLPPTMRWCHPISRAPIWLKRCGSTSARMLPISGLRGPPP